MPNAKSLASHIISKGGLQSGATLIGAELVSSSMFQKPANNH